MNPIPAGIKPATIPQARAVLRDWGMRGKTVRLGKRVVVFAVGIDRDWDEHATYYGFNLLPA